MLVDLLFLKDAQEGGQSLAWSLALSIYNRMRAIHGLICSRLLFDPDLPRQARRGA